MHYYTGKYTDTDTRRERENDSEFSISSRVHRVSRARVFSVLVYFARSFGCRRNYSQSMKEMEYVSREGYLQEELLTELNAPGFLNHNICRYKLSFFLPLSVVAAFYYGVLC